jgi:hypothetical protein
MNLRFDSFACAIGDHKSKKVIMAKLRRFALGQHFVNDLGTGAFEVDASHPEAQIWMVRIGSRYVRRFGGLTKRAV